MSAADLVRSVLPQNHADHERAILAVAACAIGMISPSTGVLRAFWRLADDAGVGDLRLEQVTWHARLGKAVAR